MAVKKFADNLIIFIINTFLKANEIKVRNILKNR